MDFSRRLCKKSIVDLWKNTTNYDITHQELEQSYYKVMNNIKSCFYYNQDSLGKEMVISLIVMCFDIRNCRGGMDGWKDGSYYLFFKLLDLFPRIMIELLKQYSEFGYWKDYQRIYEISQIKLSILAESITFVPSSEFKKYEDLNNSIINLWVKQLKKDQKKYLKNKFDRISLCSKYIPKENKSLDKKFKVCKKIANQLFKKTKTSKKEFRKLCSNLNRVIKNRKYTIEYTHKNEGKNMYIGQLINLHEKEFTYKLLRQMIKNRLYNPIIDIIKNNFSKLSKDKLLYKRIVNYKTNLPLQIKKTKSQKIKINKNVNKVIQNIVEKIEKQQEEKIIENENEKEKEFVVISSNDDDSELEIESESESSDEYIESPKNKGFLSSIKSWFFG